MIYILKTSVYLLKEVKRERKREKARFNEINKFELEVTLRALISGKQECFTDSTFTVLLKLTIFNSFNNAKKVKFAYIRYTYHKNNLYGH